MVSIAIMLVIQAVVQISLILDIYLGNGATKQRAEDWFQANASIAVVIVMAIFVFFNLVSLSLIGQLLLFHMRLQRDGLSTYQFIVRDNQRRRETAKKEDELKLRRQMALAHAKNEGKGCLSFRLKAGGLFREQCGLACCDPLTLDEEEEETAEKAPPSATANNGLSNGNGHALTVSHETSEHLDDGAEEEEEEEEETKENENV
jgi:ABC-type nickel/cobalt efflux system permease component RcnA